MTYVTVDGKQRALLTEKEIMKLPAGTVLGHDRNRDSCTVLGGTIGRFHMLNHQDSYVDTYESGPPNSFLFKENKTIKVGWRLREDNGGCGSDFVFCVFKDPKFKWQMVAGCHTFYDDKLAKLKADVLAYWSDRHETVFGEYGVYSELTDAEMRKHPSYASASLRIALNRTSRRIINKIFAAIESKPKAKKTVKRAVKKKSQVRQAARRRTR